MINHENKNVTASSPIDGMQALALAFANLPHDRALYKRTKLENPTTDTFGTHTEKRTLIEGRVRIQQEIDAGGTLMFSVLEDDGTKKVVGIGHVPDKFRQDRGGQFMIGAGRDAGKTAATDDYFMLVHQGIDNVPPKPLYVSSEQLQDLTVAPGDQDVSLNPYMETSTGGRIVRISGTVESVAILE